MREREGGESRVVPRPSLDLPAYTKSWEIERGLAREREREREREILTHS